MRTPQFCGLASWIVLSYHPMLAVFIESDDFENFIEWPVEKVRTELKNLEWRKDFFSPSSHEFNYISLKEKENNFKNSFFTKVEFLIILNKTHYLSWENFNKCKTRKKKKVKRKWEWPVKFWHLSETCSRRRICYGFRQLLSVQETYTYLCPYIQEEDCNHQRSWYLGLECLIYFINIVLFWILFHF